MDILELIIREWLDRLVEGTENWLTLKPLWALLVNIRRKIVDIQYT